MHGKQFNSDAAATIAVLLLAFLVGAATGCAGSRPKFLGGGGTSLAKNTVPDNPTAPYDNIPVSYTAPNQAELANAGPFSRTSSGLGYRILKPGAGVKPRSSDRVKVHYHGWLDDGTVFDSSYNRGTPTSFPLTGVIAGWTEGMQYVGEGGKIEFDVPAHLGYGSQDKGKIPPNSRLHFVVELLAINP